jgi:6-phosphogluconolactonase
MGNSTEAVRWHASADGGVLQKEAAQRILHAAADAIQMRGLFSIVLAGGQTPRGAYSLLRTAKTDWARWQIYFGDERCLPADDAERNSRMATEAWLGRVPIPKANVHVIPAERGATAAAAAYSETLRGVADFDLVLLGLGEDGHTASLFPGRDWGATPESPDALAITDAPKPPPQRVSLSAARLSRAHDVLFLVEGESKRDAVARWRAGADIPARAIRPSNGVAVLVEATLLRASSS